MSFLNRDSLSNPNEHPVAVSRVSRHYLASHDKLLAAWLAACAVVIFGMILLGGVTRLTESGLSMVEWRPIMGAWPPIGEAAWLEVFAKYQQFPEYQKINQGMSLGEFKVIFMYEYLHRVLGRLIGMLFALPLLFFAIKGWVKPGLMPRLLLLFVLGGCQGLLGWYMVKSGLVDRPSVSQYRLTAHLGLAVALYAAIIWQFMNLLIPRDRTTEKILTSNATLWRWSAVFCGLVFLMILSGGLVAGTDAGFSYPTWPRMGPSFIPPGLYASDPAWLAAFEDVTTIQFNHRMFAYFLVLVIGGFALVLLRQPAGQGLRRLGLGVLVTLLLQVSLGISTLLTHVAVPVAAAHQGGAIVLLTAMLLAAHTLRRISDS